MDTGRLTKADFNWNNHNPWCSIYNNEKHVLFSYKTDDLRKEVLRRTSYLGKMRGTENVPHLLDRIAFTEDESDLFSDYLKSSVSDAWDVISGFCKGKFFIDESEKVSLSELPELEPSDIDFSCNVAYSDSDRQCVVNFSELDCPGHSNEGIRLTIVFRLHYRVKFRVGTTSFYEYVEKTEDFTMVRDLDSSVSYPIDVHVPIMLEPAGIVTGAEEYDESYVASVSLLSVNVMHSNPRHIASGTCVEYKDLSGVVSWYRALCDTDENADLSDRSLFDPVPFDCTDSVLLELNVPVYFNENSLPAADVSLRESIVYGIMVQWITLSYPDELERYELLLSRSLEKFRSRLQRKECDEKVRIVPRVF